MIHKFRQTKKNVVQQLGHMAVNAGILGALTLLTTAPHLALAGCFIGVLANTFVGKETRISEGR